MSVRKTVALVLIVISVCFFGCRKTSGRTSSLIVSSQTSSFAETSAPAPGSHSAVSEEISSTASAASAPVQSGETSGGAVSSMTSPAVSSKASPAASSKASSAASSKISTAGSSAASGPQTTSGTVSRTFSASVPRKKAAERGIEAYSNGMTTIDASNKAEGYVLVTCSDQSANAPACQVICGNVTYTYQMEKGRELIYPLTCGDGSYTVTVYTKIEGNYYGVVYSATFSVSLRNPLLPFLYTNSYVDYENSAAAVSKAAELTAGAATDLDAVRAVFTYVTKTLSYNTALAEKITDGTVTSYQPDLNSVMSEKKGICYDYAALMTAMLRSQNIPCKLVTGYVKTSFHAWVSVYVDDVGWIENYVHFEGSTWQLMDPTFVSTGGVKAASKYIGDGKSYVVSKEY